MPGAVRGAGNTETNAGSEPTGTGSTYFGVQMYKVKAQFPRGEALALGEPEHGLWV